MLTGLEVLSHPALRDWVAGGQQSAQALSFLLAGREGIWYNNWYDNHGGLGLCCDIKCQVGVSDSPDPGQGRRWHEAGRLGREMTTHLFSVPVRDAKEMTLIVERKFIAYN